MRVAAQPQRFANLGLGGAHPLALAGLIEHYAGGVHGKRVVVLCNTLWLSSRQSDLSDAKVEKFNHPNLIPQFVPRVPPYKAEISDRLGVLVEQRLTFKKWTRHLQQAYYQTDIPGWTLEHPYDNPLEPLTHDPYACEDKLLHLQQPWTKGGLTAIDYPWIDLDESLQWHAFQRVVAILQGRGNHVFVVVGPFNEHMLTAASLQRYQKVKSTIAAWLTAQQIPHMVPDALPSEEYGDASHPLPKGYARLAEQLLADPNFE